MRLEMIADYKCVTGEGPLWHPDEQVLYWTDIPKGRLFRYDPATGHHEQCYEGTEAIGGFTIQADGALLLFTARGAVKTWRNGKLSTIIEEIPRELDSQFNDVIAGPAGRVYCGTISTPSQLGCLYRLDCDASLTVVVEGIIGSNGMGFTPDRQQMYYTDSDKRDIYLFDYDQETGALTNQRTFVHTADDGSVPDGMTVDAEGFVWSARWDGS